MFLCAVSVLSKDLSQFLSLRPGSTITIGQTSNTFDSKHTLRYGGVYPGDNVFECVDDPDTAVLSFTNAGEANVPVYFIVDAHSSSGRGNFVLAWMATSLNAVSPSIFSCST